MLAITNQHRGNENNLFGIMFVDLAYDSSVWISYYWNQMGVASPGTKNGTA